MLVLTRRCGDRIIIDDRIEIVVSRVEGNRVRLAIGAPPEVPIMRMELETEKAEVLTHRHLSQLDA